MCSTRSARSEDDRLHVTLRPVSPDDEDFLFRVYSSTREEELAQLPWDDAQREAFLRMQFDAQRFDYETRFANTEHSIILRAGVPVGRIWISRDEEEIRLIDIALLPEHRNAGIGAFLLRDLQAESDKAGVPLRHMVLISNDAAIRFYKRLGFSVVSDTGTHFLMERLPAP